MHVIPSWPSPVQNYIQTAPTAPHLTRLAAAAAVARSDLPLRLLGPTASLVRLGFDADDVIAACDARLACAVPCAAPATVDCRRAPALFGDESCRRLTGALRPPAGGCGSGRDPPDVVIELTLLIGELLTPPTKLRRAAAVLILTPVMNSCLFAS